MNTEFTEEKMRARRANAERIRFGIVGRVLTAAALVAAFWVATAMHAQSGASDSWKRVEVGTTASFRGLSAVSGDVVWASGTCGTVIRTVDGGKNWDVRVVQGAENQDFRGIRAFDAENAVIMSTGNAEKGLATIYRTSDGGKTWTQTFAPKTIGVFFDSIAFWDRKRGVVLSDPVDGHFVLFRTTDGGATWTQIPPEKLPAALKGEGSFAASNSCIAVEGEKNIWFVTGGASVARVLRSSDAGETWAVAETPVRPANASSGLFSVVFMDAEHGTAVGGDYAQPTNSPVPNLIRSSDGGKTWHVEENPTEPRNLFLSSVAYAPGMVVYGPVTVNVTGIVFLRAVGSGGAIAEHGGRPWSFDSNQNFNTVAISREGATWAVGPKGFVARWQFRD